MGVAANQRNPLLSIQYLRAFAACAVLVFHAAERAQVNIGVGAAGVDVFFVISGFIMWTVTVAVPPTPAKFLHRRIERIVPLYWLVTLGLALMAIVRPEVLPNMKITASHVAASLFFIPHLDPNGQPYPVVVPGWSLNFEMFFYLLFAAALFFPARRRLVVITAFLSAFVLAGLLVTSASPVWAMVTSPMLLEFLAGILLGAVFTRGAEIPRWASLLLLAGGLAGFAATMLLPRWTEAERLVVWGLPALMLVTGAVFFERSAGMRDIKWLHLLGDASYSIYLVHGLAISFGFRILNLGALPWALSTAVCVAAGVAGGLITYWLVERPTLSLTRKLFRMPRPPARPAAANATP